MTNTDTEPTTTAPKPGWKTSELYLKLAAVLLSTLFAAGVIPTSGTVATVAAIAASMLGALGYTVSRTLVKTAARTASMLLVVLAIAGACGAAPNAKAVAVAGKDAVLQCTKADAAPLLALLAELGADALGSALHVGGIDYDALVDKAVANGKVVGGCAGLEFLAALRKAQPAAAMRPLVAAPDPIDEAAEKIRARLGGHWDLGDGTVL